MNYHNGTTWVAIPDAALYSTYAGTYHVEYPKATDYAGDGSPCGAVGLPRIIIRAQWMTDTGFGFWRGLLGSSANESAVIKIEAFDERAGSNVKWLGKLERPTHSGIGRGSAAGNTEYRGVQIIISSCTVTT